MNQTEQMQLARQAVAAIENPKQDLSSISFGCWVALVCQFRRLDAKEQKQREAGALGKEHGKKGGRPKKAKPVTA